MLTKKYMHYARSTCVICDKYDGLISPLLLCIAG